MTRYPSRALVLGGGGITGIGWQVGVLAGLGDEGVDLRDANIVIGTSAGSFVGTNYASGVDWAEVFARQARVTETEPVMRVRPELYEAWVNAFRAAGPDRRDFRAIGAGFGHVARSFPVTMDSKARRDVVRGRLFTDVWPASLRVTVTDADTGELCLLGPDAGLPIEVATMASGAVPGIWPVVRHNGREWIDAGMVSPANAHLAKGHDRIVVLAPMPASGPGTPSAHDDVARLNESAVAVLATPDEESRAAFGENPYDPGRAAAAAESGRRQGRVFATHVAAIW